MSETRPTRAPGSHLVSAPGNHGRSRENADPAGRDSRCRPRRRTQDRRASSEYPQAKQLLGALAHSRGMATRRTPRDSSRPRSSCRCWSARRSSPPPRATRRARRSSSTRRARSSARSRKSRSRCPRTSPHRSRARTETAAADAGGGGPAQRRRRRRRRKRPQDRRSRRRRPTKPPRQRATASSTRPASQRRRPAG